MFETTTTASIPAVPNRLSAKMAKRIAKKPHARQCSDCGARLPKYPGRYPRKCPACKAKYKTESSVPKRFKLSFDKIGYINNLHNLLSQEGLIFNRDWKYERDVLELSPNVSLSDGVKEWLLKALS